MAEEKTTLEVIAPTVEEAVEKGLSDLGLSREAVDVEVLDEGKRNLFRFATRQARVRLIVKSSAKAAGYLNIPRETASTEAQTDSFHPAEIQIGELNADQVVVRDTLVELLTKMGINAKVSISYAETDPEEKPVVLANIEGDDLSYLIGRKAETLNALQYILSLMVSHKTSHWIPIQVDVQHYRARRQTELKKLARRAADQVLATGRKQYLEPMPANERRIIHMELRKNENVSTESTGEEPNRKVCVYPNR